MMARQLKLREGLIKQGWDACRPSLPVARLMRVAVGGEYTLLNVSRGLRDLGNLVAQ
jgi:hypothetical protein